MEFLKHNNVIPKDGINAKASILNLKKQKEMKLTKQDVCVFIENKQQLQEARELLERYGEIIDDEMFYIYGSEESLNYLQVVDNDYGWWLALNRKANGDILNVVTLPELEQILKEENLNEM